MSLPKSDRNIRSKNGSDGSGPADGGPAGFGRAVASSIRADFGSSTSAVKTVSSLTGANERAVKNWFQGRNAPSVYFLTVLARHSTSVLKLILVRAGREDALVGVDVAVAHAALTSALATLEACRAGSAPAS